MLTDGTPYFVGIVWIVDVRLTFHQGMKRSKSIKYFSSKLWGPTVGILTKISSEKSCKHACMHACMHAYIHTIYTVIQLIMDPDVDHIRTMRAPLISVISPKSNQA